MTTLIAKAISFSANACVDYRYVGCRRPRPGPKAFSSFWLSLSRKCYAARRGTDFVFTPRLRTFYRAEDYPPEPPISGCQRAKSPANDTHHYTMRGSVPDFPCRFENDSPRLVI